MTPIRDLVELYWAAWKIGLKNVKQPRPENGFVSPYHDEAFNPSIFMWDSAFMVMFGRFAQDAVPGVRTFDNFYAHQHPDGFIDRQIREEDGSDYWGPDSPRSINPPLYGWAEWEAFLVTGDRERLKRVYPVLKKYYEWIRAHRRREDGLYWTSALASGMDNTVRIAAAGRDDGEHYGYAWIDMTAQQALNALYLSRIAAAVGLGEDAAAWRSEWEDLSRRINERMWDDADGMYYDLDASGAFTKVKSIASFWPLVAEAAPPERAARLVKEHLMNAGEFWRPHPFPTLSKDDPAYVPGGGYWNGAVWAPTNYMTVKGLSKYGEEDFATAAVMRHLKRMHRVLIVNGSIFENYSPEYDWPGRPSMGEFVGWSGVGPIAMLIENVIGIRPNAPEDALLWRIRRTDRHGLENFRFGDNGSVSLIADAREGKNSPIVLTVESGGPFLLRLDLPWGTEEREISGGKTSFTLKY